MVNYPIGDLLIRIKNAASAGRNTVVVSKTKLGKAVAEVLKKEGFLTEVSSDHEGLKLDLAVRSKKPVLMGMKLISKPGLRIYMGAKEIESRRGVSILILSTPKGVMSSRQAKKERTGGEVIAEVW